MVCEILRIDLYVHCFSFQVWEGVNIITVGRKMLGATDPAKSEPGTIRGDYAIVTGR